MKRSDFFTMENGILHITSNAHMYPLSTLIRTELLLRPLSHNNLNTILNGTLFSGNGYEPLNIYLRLQFQDGTNEDMLLTPKPVIRHNLDYYEIVRRGRKLQEILNYWLREIEACRHPFFTVYTFLQSACRQHIIAFFSFPDNACV